MQYGHTFVPVGHIFILNLGDTVMLQLHALAPSPPGKQTPVINEQEAGRAPDPVWTFWGRTKFLDLMAIKPLLLGYQTHTLATIPTEPFRLVIWLPCIKTFSCRSGCAIN